MISLVILISILFDSTSIAFIGSLVIAITFMFIHDMSSYEDFNNNEEKSINDFKNLTSNFFCLYPYIHLRKIITRLILSELRWLYKSDLSFSELHESWITLFKIGSFLFLILIIKIFILDNIKISYFDKFIFKILGVNSDITDNDSDVIEEKEFTNQKASKENSILILKNLDKLYFSFIRRFAKYACKDISFSLRNNEVIFIYD